MSTGILITDLAGVSRPRALAAGEVLVEQGDEADEVFVVLTGRLDAVSSATGAEVVVGALGPGEIVGEITVIAGGRRTATLRATEPTEVLVIPRYEFEAWLGRHPSSADAVSAEARARVDRSQVAAMVAQLVGDAEPELVQAVVDRVEWRRLVAGEVLFEEGDPSDAAYFVVSGRLLVFARDDQGTPRPLTEMGRGQVVGELGLLDRAPRSATVRALRDTTLARFSTDLFDDLVLRSPALMLHVARGLLTRLRREPRSDINRAASVAVAVTARCDAEPLLGAIEDAMARFGSVRRLSSGTVDRLLNRPDIAQAHRDHVGVPRLSEFLHEADVGNDYLLLETDSTITGWTSRSLRQADRVVVVCSAHPDADERRRVRDLLAEVHDLEHVTTMLAVFHPATTDRPRGTAALVREFDVDEVVHVRAAVPGDAARLGRLVSGNGVGVVLSGGGARGFAHIGVLRALVDAGVPIDAICGTSIGAVFAGGIATGMTHAELVPAAERLFHNLLDYTVPVVSVMKGERISASIAEVFDDWDIEDLVVPYYCVSTNLTRSQLEIHRRGNAFRAIRASVAIPGILPPVPMGDDLLVDGGVLDNMPFVPMRADPRIGTVIAVDVAPERGPRSKGDFGTSVSGVRALGGRLRRRPTPYPSIGAVLLRSMLVGAVHNQRNALHDGAVDLHLHLDLPGVGLLDFERVAEVEALGHAASVERITTWAAQAGWASAS